MVSLIDTARSAAGRAKDEITYLAASGSGSGWEIGNFFTNAQTSLKSIGAVFLGLLGVVCLIAGATFVVQKLMSEHSRRSWFTVIALILVGGLLLVGGFSIVQSIASGAQETVVELGN
ncbi:MAG: hypothetical protein LBG60_13235 [Bifidobacteriaceae bacterium]|jgi:uncharacterized membrane protein|nr:hypothetical protein [Bifidobacteriaceae bacterium]